MQIAWYHLMMLGAFALTIFFARNSPRPFLWSVVLLASYLIAEAYLFIPKPTTFNIPWDGNVFVGPWAPQALFNVVLDGAVCALILHFARKRWEGVIFSLVMLAFLTGLIQATSIMRGAGPAIPDRTYGIILEGFQYLALGFIWWELRMERANDSHDYRSFDGSRLAGWLGFVPAVSMAIRQFLQSPWRPSSHWKA